MEINKEKILEFIKKDCEEKFVYFDFEEQLKNLSEETWINKNLGLDELDFVELIMDIEEEFNIHIDDSDFRFFGNDDYQIKDILNNIKK